MASDVAERFMRFVSPEPMSGCWLWTGSVLAGGYGQFQIDGSPEKAHRMAYRLFVGSPSGLHVCHRCDVRSCVNPSHLFLGTPAENIADKVAKGRQARGSRQGSAKLIESSLTELRDRTKSPKELASKYGVSVSSIFRVRSGKTWGHCHGR